MFICPVGNPKFHTIEDKVIANNYDFQRFTFLVFFPRIYQQSKEPVSICSTKEQ
jgi:hypothetical protein